MGEGIASRPPAPSPTTGGQPETARSRLTGGSPVLRRVAKVGARQIGPDLVVYAFVLVFVFDELAFTPLLLLLPQRWRTPCIPSFGMRVPALW